MNFLYILCLAFPWVNHQSQPDLTSLPIIPQPTEVRAAYGSFKLIRNTKISVLSTASSEWLLIAEYLGKKWRPSTGFPLTVKAVSKKPVSGIFITPVSDVTLGEEGYTLKIDANIITISSYKPAGAFRAIQTLRQLLPASLEKRMLQSGIWTIPTGKIHDKPTYAYRGMMLDVARHFFTVEEVKKVIDYIAAYKFNMLHLHLTDDQGWRIEIKSWPNLTAHGGKTEVGGGVGGFYTQAQYKEIVNYAQDHYITIVPEIDMPSHINAALASYGELNAGTIVPEKGRVPVDEKNDRANDTKFKPTALYTGIEVGWSSLSLAQPATFRFVEDVIKEVCSITPGPFFHIGGDEALATKKEDYLIFINRFQEIVTAQNKIMIGWEEIAQTEIKKQTVAQYWNLSKSKLIQEAVEKGGQILFSPASKAYLDMKYDSTSTYGLKWAGYIEVDSAYSWSPLTLAPTVAKKDILGVEACLWSETVSSLHEAEYLLFPRLLGYAEIGWTTDEKRNWTEYKARLAKHGLRFKAWGVNYYASKLVSWE